MRFFAATILAALLLTVGSCQAPFAPPDNARAFVPTADYAAAWKQVELCAGASGALERIHWYVVADSAIACPAGECSGVWYPPHDIYLTEQYVHDVQGNYLVARHEMLHDLLQVADHPAVFCTCGLGGTDPATGGCPLN